MKTTAYFVTFFIFREYIKIGGDKQMSNCCCERGNTCTTIGVTISVILGIVAAFLRYFAVIAPAPAFYWVLLGIGVVYPAVILLSAFRGNGNHSCICNALSVCRWGVAGTIITSLLLLGITFAATSIIGAILTGLSVGFFALLISSVLCIINCLCTLLAGFGE